LVGPGVAGVFERLLDDGFDPLGDPGLVDHPRDDQATAMDVERGWCCRPGRGAPSLARPLTV
jgi:hypothetical protein